MTEETALHTLTLVPSELHLLAKALCTHHVFLHNAGVHCCDLTEAEGIADDLKVALELYKRVTGLL